MCERRLTFFPVSLDVAWLCPPCFVVHLSLLAPPLFYCLQLEIPPWPTRTGLLRGELANPRDLDFKPISTCWRFYWFHWTTLLLNSMFFFGLIWVVCCAFSFCQFGPAATSLVNERVLVLSGIHVFRLRKKQRQCTFTRFRYMSYINVLCLDVSFLWASEDNPINRGLELKTGFQMDDPLPGISSV